MMMMMMMRSIVLFMIFLGVESYNVTHQNQLNTDLLTGYDRRVRPDAGSTPTNISVSFFATSLKEFSESEGKIALVGSILYCPGIRDKRLSGGRIC